MKTFLHTGKSTGKILLLVFASFIFSKTSWAQPANDDCANAIELFPALTCTNTSGSVENSSISGAPNCGGTIRYDVWYYFTATSANPSIRLSSIGANFLNPRIQIINANCAGTSVTCNTAAFIETANLGLTIGNVYYIRVYSLTNPIPTTNATFDICIVDPPAPANDLCGNAELLTSGATCSPVPGTIVNARVATGDPACGTVRYDVWYSFVAQTPNPSIRLSNIGATFAAQTPRVQVLTGSCGALTQVYCNTAAIAANAPMGLTVGSTYYVRIFSISTAVPASNGGFDICIVDPPLPVNDDCVNSTLLTSSTSIVNYTDSVTNSTPATGVPAACAGTARYDVWYRFVAQTTNPTIRLTNPGTGGNFFGQTPRVQLFSGADCATLTSVSCGTATYNPTGLAIGSTYYLRVYSTTTAAVPNINGMFNISIQDPLPPVNNDCSGATTLIPSTTCSNTNGTLLNATATAGIPGDCGDPNSPEVWYSFTATTPFPTISINTVGAQLNAAGPRLQLLSGSCGSFTSLACVSGTAIYTGAELAGTGLTIGNTYYIRVYTNSSAMSGTAWAFRICVTDAVVPVIDYGKSYVNITKGANGGTIEPGDVLELRATVAVRTGSAFSASFLGSIPANTTYVPNTLRILTNEGKIYKQWTDAADSDPATISGSTVSINMGRGASSTYGGLLRQGDRPIAGGANMTMATYRVVVDAVPFGSNINVGGGTFTYANPDGSITNVNFPVVNAIVYRNTGICANSVGSNGVLAESAGTFGSGNIKDQGASASVPSNYAYTAFGANAPGDYFYGVSNNTSGSIAPANYSNIFMDPDPTKKVFGHWDVIGDHTGATNPLVGNAPADVVAGQTGGYMVVINASYRTDTAFLYSVTNLCPNTSYEYSAWFRNICRTCGTDSTGVGYQTAGYIPNTPGDSSGVHPSLSFNINGADYYTTGDILYTGQWIKKGFTYKTGPAETSMTISIRNNAPGGGGNDWAIDDIGLATCSPYLDINPSTSNINVCYADGFSLSAIVRSFYEDYTYYVWEQSTDNGATFTNTTYSSNGTITPVYNGTEYEYTAIGPSFIGDSTTHGNIYRLRVASSAGNIVDPNCSFLATRTVQVFVNSCMWLLKTDLLSASGVLQNNFSRIQWQTANEDEKVNFEIEKSVDGKHFTPIGKIQGNASGAGNGNYLFADPIALKAPAYYRIKMIERGEYKYSKIILLSPNTLFFEVKNLVNPFTNTLSFDVITPADGELKVTLFDNFGRVVKRHRETTFKGISAIKIPNLGYLSGGTYALRIEYQNETVIKRIIKLNN